MKLRMTVYPEIFYKEKQKQTAHIRAKSAKGLRNCERPPLSQGKAMTDANGGPPQGADDDGELEPSELGTKKQ